MVALPRAARRALCRVLALALPLLLLGATLERPAYAANEHSDYVTKYKHVVQHMRNALSAGPFEGSENEAGPSNAPRELYADGQIRVPIGTLGYRDENVELVIDRSNVYVLGFYQPERNRYFPFNDSAPVDFSLFETRPAITRLPFSSQYRSMGFTSLDVTVSEVGLAGAVSTLAEAREGEVLNYLGSSLATIIVGVVEAVRNRAIEQPMEIALASGQSWSAQVWAKVIRAWSHMSEAFRRGEGYDVTIGGRTGPWSRTGIGLRLALLARPKTSNPRTTQWSIRNLSLPMPSAGWPVAQIQSQATGGCLDLNMSTGGITQWDCHSGTNQLWQLKSVDDGSMELVSQASGKCVDLNRSTGEIAQWDCNGGLNQRWISEYAQFSSKYNGLCLDPAGSGNGAKLRLAVCADPDDDTTGDAGDPFDSAVDDRKPKPAVQGAQSQCRPDGMTVTAGVDARYCDVYDTDGREWLGGAGHDKRVVGYFTGWRTGAKGDPRYLVKNIPWSKVTHVNYAFAGIVDNKISIGNTEDSGNPATGMTWTGVTGAEMDPSLPYRGHFNQLATYKKRHPQVKVLMSVGGWADTKGFYTMATNADGSVNQAGIDTFADSVVGFLDRYKDAFDGIDIDYEYPTALPKTGNPSDWNVSDARRKGLAAGNTALMKTLRARLDKAGTDRSRYYLLTSAASASGHLVRGYDAGQALRYQDFVNVMSYDLHGSWNNFVGPQAPLYDDGKDNELSAAGIYDTARNPEFDKTGYFNVDWAYHYYRAALPPSRINLGIPYYTRGWQNVTGGTDGLWGTSALADQNQCQPGTGPQSGAANAQACGNGAVGIDNIWHDLGGAGQEVASGSSPLWHAKNLQNNITPGYLGSYGVDPSTADGRLKGTYVEKYDATLKASWLWNAEKKVFLSTENDASIDAKTQYVRDNGIGGVMMWELAGDYTKRVDGQYGMGYDVTTRVDNALRSTGGAKADRTGVTRLPDQVVDVKTELVDFPTDVANMWPIQPTLRITNNTKTALVQGTQVSFDLPTSTSPLVKDAAWQKLDGLAPGRLGPNAGGLKADFHRLTITLQYCQDIAPGKSLDIPVKYYLPITGPTNTIIKINGKEYGTTGDQRRGTSTVEPSAGNGTACKAPQWNSGRKGDKARPYSPNGGRIWTLWDKGNSLFQVQNNSGTTVLDHFTGTDTPGLWAGLDNDNQKWGVLKVGAKGGYVIANQGKCLTSGGIAGEATLKPCDFASDAQSWQLMATDPATGASTGPAAPAHGKAYRLQSMTGVVAETPVGDVSQGVHVMNGDENGATASTVWWSGSYWRASYWTTGEPGQDPAWVRIAAKS
ncbi:MULTISPECIES: glycosyl hydrolase family 18 protein [unclassified Streptomyces]|uniref:glycosyl hydrolase family 18 protein n=1 Tax=unclassified Streptomyces TaxID=2593676 RepID=UPI0016617B65|nr:MULTISPECIES: glycosyl hydrolase family 18 protein [unclassified Streptomyces]MBD0710660.1 hypothetical protein [Streptomyces sp. CBMA291]MBD0715507.1 hypothetical protein [Streptomyces sp. CBMA370]